MKIVVDTNVLVSALLRSKSIPARIIDLILSRQVTLVLDHRIYNEYQEVLFGPEFGFPRDAVDDLLDFLWRSSERANAPATAIELPDPDDAKFLEVARISAADALVTGNLKHFPARQRSGVQVFSPREWWELWSKNE